MKANRIFCKVLALVIIITMIVTALASTVAAASNESLPLYCTARVVNATKLNLRREPQGEIIGKLATNKTVTILSQIDRNGYYHVRVDETGLECYAYGEYLEFVAYHVQNTPVIVPGFTYEPDEEITYPEIFESEGEKPGYFKGATLVVTSEKQLNFRKKPSRKGYRLKYLYRGDKLEIVSSTVTNGYILAKDLSDGMIGYVSLDYVQLDGTVGTFPEVCTCNCTCNCSSCCSNK